MHPSDPPFHNFVQAIRSVVLDAKQQAIEQVNQELLQAYWQIGRILVEQEAQQSLNRKQFILTLSRQLTRELGRGFSRSNLNNMRSLYEQYPDIQALAGSLSWSHWCELLSIGDAYRRAFYKKEAEEANWSVRELKRQIKSSLFERLLLSKGDINKNEVLKLAKESQQIQKASDLIKEPYVLEFLGIPEQKPLLERDLERKLIRQIEFFLLELGKGFMFVGSQQRVSIGNHHHYVDMVFYNKILRSYVFIDLKMGKFIPAHAGQMNAYLNYYKTEINEDIDNDPIGIILCTDKEEIVAEYALGGLNNQRFASKYVYYLPNKDALIQQVHRALASYDEEE
jgi:predicted nuclease of restriction endonuclease-like (RecB) superfamily